MSGLLDFVKAFLFWIPRRIDGRLRQHYTGGPQSERDRQTLESLAQAMSEAMSQLAELRRGYNMTPGKHSAAAYREVLRTAELVSRLNDPVLAGHVLTFREEIGGFVEPDHPGRSDPDAVKSAFESAMTRIAEMQAGLRQRSTGR